MPYYAEQTAEELATRAKMQEDYLSEGGHSNREINRVREDLLQEVVVDSISQQPLFI